LQKFSGGNVSSLKVININAALGNMLLILHKSDPPLPTPISAVYQAKFPLPNSLAVAAATNNGC
jgi:hypothetical protein